MPQGSAGKLPIEFKHIRYIVGYALTSTWATVLLFSSSFTTASSAATVMLSMLPGVVACLGVLLLRFHIPMFDGLTPAASLYATGMAVGTLLCTYPALSTSPAVHTAGLLVSGFFAILLILTWFDAFSRLNARTIVLLAGCALLLSAVACFAVLACPAEVASVVMAALPLVSLSCLPRPTNKAAEARRPSLAAVVREAVSWKTLLGVAISFFVIGAIGSLAASLGLQPQIDPAYLLVPLLIASVFVVSALTAPARIDASILYKLLLLGVAAVAFLFVYYGNTNRSLLFFAYITADVLLWTVLALATKKTPVAPYAVFAVGWLAECVGNVIGQNTATLVGDTPLLLGIVIMLILVAVGFAFGDGLFVLDLGEDAESYAGAVEGPDANALVGADLAGARDADVRIGGESHVETHAPKPSSIGETDIAANMPGVGAMESASIEATDSPTSEVRADDTPEADAQTGGHLEEGAQTGGHLEEGAPSQEAAIASFVDAHALSTREADVFALWVTGHGLKYIQDTLFISESTVKTHLRSIYRKCDTHSRAEIIDLFERESAEAKA